MDIKRRKQADPTALAEAMLVPCSRIMVIAQAYRRLINLLDGDIQAAEDNPFYWEHIAGSGWHGVQNQNSSCTAYLLRQANDAYGLRAVDGNWGAMFVSARALAHLMENGTPIPKAFSTHYHCEHTVPIKQRNIEIMAWILEANINDPIEIARSVLRNTVVATVLKAEENNSGDHTNTSHRPFWRYADMHTSVLGWHATKGMIPATNLTMGDITDLQQNQDPLISGIISALNRMPAAGVQGHMADAYDYIYYGGQAYHRIPVDLNIFVKKGGWTRQDLWEIEDRHYNHKPAKNSYTGKRP